MNIKKVPISIRICACALALIIIVLGIVLSTAKSKALVTLNKDGYKVQFSVNHYQFLLSRWKGALVSGNVTNNGYNAEQDAFYDLKDKFNGTDLQTLSEYYSDRILENCKTYTAVLWLFESMNLSLSEEQIQSVDQQMADILNAYGGSKTKLNALLGTYGINYNLLREMYLIEEKISVVKNALYGTEGSLLGEEVKEQFLEDNYVRFKQIFLPYFTYVYKTDANGDEIYYLKESTTATVAYDTVKGYRRQLQAGAYETDTNGDEIYYTSEDYTHIAYNKDETVSTRSYVLDANGNAKTKEMTQDEINEVKKKGDTLFASLKDCTVTSFEAAMRENNDEDASKTYTDGYYLQKNIDYAAVSTEFAYFSDIIEQADTMKAGDISAITSDGAGYHIIMKYDPTPKAYENAENEVWFKNFTSTLIDELFWQECEALFDEMVVNEKLLAKAPDIKEIGVNGEF